MGKRKYYVEQVDEEDESKKAPMKEQAEENKGGILAKDLDPAVASKAEQPEELKTEVLKEEAPAVDSDMLSQVLSAINDLKAEIASMKAEKTVEAEPMTEEVKEEPKPEVPKVEEEAVKDKEEEKPVEVMTEKIGKRRTVVDSNIREVFDSRNAFQEAMKSYANNVKGVVA